LIYLPSAYLFSAQLWSSLEISPLWPCFHLCFVIKPFDPHQRVFWTVSTSIGIPPDGTGRAGLRGTEGRADWGRQNVERGAGQGRAERIGAAVVDRSVDWKALLVNRAWSILRAAAYQASGSLSAGRLKGIVAIWPWMFVLRSRRNFTTRVWGSVYLASETKVRKQSR